MSPSLVNRFGSFLRREPIVGGRFVWLIYLGFLLMPLVGQEKSPHWLWPTLISMVVFVLIYLQRVRDWQTDGVMEPSGWRGYRASVLTALLCYAVSTVNPWAMAYMSYSGVFAGMSSRRLLPPVLLIAVLLAIYTAEALLLGLPATLIAITILIGTVCCLSNYVVAENRRKLRFSQEEVRRLATLAERERIGRDLHDLLGHTLSLIAIKSELAGKLLERNREEAAREVAEVTSIAREALKQVRTAVNGIRSAALDVELASTTTLLKSSGISVTCHRDSGVLSPEVETALAMIVREATTNIHRHAHASQASIEVRMGAEAIGSRERGTVYLLVRDNGRGGVANRGNGLAGIDERVRLLGGKLEIESERGQGTTLRVRFPVESSGGQTASAVASTPLAGTGPNAPQPPEVPASRQTNDGSPGPWGHPMSCRSSSQATST